MELLSTVEYVAHSFDMHCHCFLNALYMKLMSCCFVRNSYRLLLLSTLHARARQALEALLDALARYFLLLQVSASVQTDASHEASHGVTHTR